MGRSGTSRRTSPPSGPCRVRSAPRSSCLRRWSRTTNRFAVRRRCPSPSTQSTHLRSSCHTSLGRMCRPARALRSRQPCRRNRSSGSALGNVCAAAPAPKASDPRRPPVACGLSAKPRARPQCTPVPGPSSTSSPPTRRPTTLIRAAGRAKTGVVALPACRFQRGQAPRAPPLVSSHTPSISIGILILVVTHPVSRHAP